MRRTAGVDVKLPSQIATGMAQVGGQAVVDLRDWKGKGPPAPSFVSSFRPWRCIAGCSIIDLRSLACEKEMEPFMRRTACKGKLVISEAHECLTAAIAQVFKAN